MGLVRGRRCSVILSTVVIKDDEWNDLELTIDIQITRFEGKIVFGTNLQGACNDHLSFHSVAINTLRFAHYQNTDQDMPSPP